ncbi:MAG TPA: short-chain dehydrogenase, partial [Rhodanobacteraceae bacterium]|nr:short-chain dehydrogenase [Rhodanobacteraceae bacterium]
MKRSSTKGSTKTTVASQRTIQRATDRRDARKSDAPPKKKPVQAGPRKEPENPLPAQHLVKPGRESDLRPAPRFEAKDYRGSGKLRGQRILRLLAW